MNCFSSIKLIPVLIYLKHRYHICSYVELPYLLTISVKFYFSLLKPSWTQPSSSSSLIPLFCPLHSITSHQKYWIYQTICKAKSINFIILLWLDNRYRYTYHDTLWVKDATHQKAEPLRAASLSNLDNNNSTFNLQYKVCWILFKMVGAPSFSQPSLSIQPALQKNFFSQFSPFYFTLTCSQNHLYNLH